MTVAHDRCADQHGCALSFSRSDRERLAVVHATFTGGGEGMLELAKNECVGNDAPRRDAFAFFIQEGCVIEDVRRGRKPLDECSQLRGVYVIGGEVSAARNQYRRGQIAERGLQRSLTMVNVIAERFGDWVL